MLQNSNKWGRKTTTSIELENKKCEFENCENNVFISILDLNYLKMMIFEYLTNLTKQEQEIELARFNKSLYVDDFCRVHLIKIYLSYLKELEIINILIPHSNQEIESWFFTFLIKNKTNDEWLRCYQDNKGTDILRHSLKKLFLMIFWKQTIVKLDDSMRLHII